MCIFVADEQPAFQAGKAGAVARLGGGAALAEVPTEEILAELERRLELR